MKSIEEPREEQKILVVDDEAEMVRFLVEILEAEGYKTCAAHSGEEALSKLEDEAIGLVISDIEMPASPTSSSS